MPLEAYGVLSGTVVDHRLATAANSHLQLHVVDGEGTHFRIAINVKSDLAPSELEYLIDPARRPGADRRRARQRRAAPGSLRESPSPTAAARSACSTRVA
jgi:hypothetical protein